MKTKNILTLIMLFVICTMQAENEEPQAWGYVETLKDEWLRAIGTQGLDTVYIVGEKGLIAKSTDQGSNWQKSYFSTEVNLNTVLFLNQQTGIAAGENGTVLKTTDAGENWTQVATPTTEHINAIARAGNNSIWAVGNSSLVMRSEDNGDSWQTVNLLAKQLRLNDIAFRESVGYIVGDSAIVYKTEDNGVNWENKELIENARAWDELMSITIIEEKVFIQKDILFDIYVIDNDFNKLKIIETQRKAYFINDSTCYYFLEYIATCGGCNDLENLRRHELINGEEKYPNGVSVFGLHKAKDQYSGYNYYDSKMTNDTLGYAIHGQLLLKTPSPQHNNDDTFLRNETLTNKAIKLISTTDNIIIESNFINIRSINIFDISGSMLMHIHNDNLMTKYNISTENLSTGIYIIKVTLEDNSIISTKWIKN